MMLSQEQQPAHAPHQDKAEADERGDPERLVGCAGLSEALSRKRNNTSASHSFIEHQERLKEELLEEGVKMAATSGGNCCAGCREPIKDKFLFAVNGLHWHQDCVQCADCALKLNERCHEREGKLYCKLDYWRRFGPKCFACAQTIERGELVQRIHKDNRVYHLKCFTCNQCHKMLRAGEQLHLVEGKRLLCKQDAHHQAHQQSLEPAKAQEQKASSNYSSAQISCPPSARGNGNGNSEAVAVAEQQATYYTLTSPHERRLKSESVEQSVEEPNEELADELEELEQEEELEEEELEEADEEQLMAAAEFGAERYATAGLRSLLGTYEADSNNRENEENRSVFGPLGGGGSLAGAESQQATNQQQSGQQQQGSKLQPLAKNKAAEPQGKHQQQTQQQLQLNGKRKRRRRQKAALTVALADGAVEEGGARRHLAGSGPGAAKRLANRNGESILNGASGASILTSAPSSHGHSASAHLLAGHAHHQHLSHSQQQQQQQQQQLQLLQQQQQATNINNNNNKSVSSSANSTASNSSTSSSLSLAQAHQQHNQNSNSSSANNAISQQQSAAAGHKPTRVRTVLNEKQLQTLRDCYAHNPRPDALTKEQLVDMTGLSSRVIRVWFQNKRCKDKKKSILYKQMQQHEKDGRHLAGLTLMRGVPLVASSPIQYDDHSTVSSTPGAQQPAAGILELGGVAAGREPAQAKQAGSPLLGNQQQEQQQQQHQQQQQQQQPQQQQPHYTPAVHGRHSPPAAPVDIHAYQPPWKSLIDYAHQQQQQQQQQQAPAHPHAGLAPANTPPELNADSPRYQQLLGQIHGYEEQLALGLQPPPPRQTMPPFGYNTQPEHLAAHHAHQQAMSAAHLHQFQQ